MVGQSALSTITNDISLRRFSECVNGSVFHSCRAALGTPDSRRQVRQQVQKCKQLSCRTGKDPQNSVIRPQRYTVLCVICIKACFVGGNDLFDVYVKHSKVAQLQVKAIVIVGTGLYTPDV